MSCLCSKTFFVLFCVFGLHVTKHNINGKFALYMHCCDKYTVQARHFYLQNNILLRYFDISQLKKNAREGIAMSYLWSNNS